MWLIIIAILGALIYWITQSGLVPPPNATTVIQIRTGELRVTRGRIPPHAREHVTDILADAKVTRGFIAMTRSRKVIFSRHIPQAIRQQLRNVLMNQWA